MHILLTTDTVGGVWTFTKELTEQLLNQRHRVSLVSFGRAPSTMQRAWAEALTAAYRDGFSLYACDAPLEWMQENDATWDKGAELLMKVAQEVEPDILHTNQFCWGALALKMPKLVTVHSDVRTWADACSKDLTSSPWLDRYDSLVQDGINGADVLVAPTGWMRDALRVHFDVAMPTHVIANGRTLPRFDEEHKRDLRAVSVGRLWDEGKGLAILSEITPPMPMLLAGEPSFDGEASNDLPSNVTTLGTLDEKSIMELFRNSSVYLATSLYEPFGLAPLEAALCGCAIVARDLPSLREVWEDAALYFDDAVGLQNILTRLSRDSGMMHQAQGAALARALTFTARRKADSYISLYREMIDGASGSMQAVPEELHAA